jgi:hypothetical protein
MQRSSNFENTLLPSRGLNVCLSVQCAREKFFAFCVTEEKYAFISDVPDLHSLYADPDPAFLTKADPDPDIYPNQGLKLANFFQSEIQILGIIK